MAAGPVTFYYQGWLGTVDGAIRYLYDTLTCALLDANYTPDQALHSVWSDVQSYEIASQPDYSPQTLANKSVSLSADKVVLFADPVDFGDAVTLTAKFLVVYQNTGDPATSRLLFYVDLNAGSADPVQVNNTNFDILWDANGIYASIV